TRASVVVPVDSARIQRALGAGITAAHAKRWLTALGCRVTGTAARWRVRAPSWRRDLKLDVDVIEEIARCAGYDRLPATIPVAPIAAASAQSSSFARAQRLRDLCAGLGLTEIASWSLLSKEQLDRTSLAAGAVALANPLSQDHAWLRPSLLPSMLQVA